MSSEDGSWKVDQGSGLQLQVSQTWLTSSTSVSSSRSFCAVLLVLRHLSSPALTPTCLLLSIHVSSASPADTNLRFLCNFLN